MKIIKSGKSVKKVVGKICTVQISDLNVDHSYQRELCSKHTVFRTTLVEEAFGFPLIGKRQDESLWIIDGQQRTERKRKEGCTTIDVEVVPSNGPEYEATIFKIVNKGRKPLSALQLFQAGLTSHDVTCWRIKEIVEEYGFSIPGGNTKRTRDATQGTSSIRAVGSLERIYTSGKEEGLRFVLSILKQLNDEDPYRVSDDMILGLYFFWSDRRRKQVDEERLLDRLGSIPLGKIKFSAGEGCGNRYSNVADRLLKIYMQRSRKS